MKRSIISHGKVTVDTPTYHIPFINKKGISLSFPIYKIQKIILLHW